MYRVLVPVDDDRDRAMTQARFVTSLPGRESIEAWVVHAFHGAEREATRLDADRIGSVSAVREFLEEEQITVETTDIGLPPEEGILNWAEEIDADLIILGGRKRSPAGKAVFGSVTQSVILGSERPVVVTGG